MEMNEKFGRMRRHGFQARHNAHDNTRIQGHSLHGIQYEWCFDVISVLPFVEDFL
jgi:hypothetical protein